MMRDNFGKEWLETLEQKFSSVSEIKEIQSKGKPTIRVFYFDDLPQSGCLTAVTCGLSNANYPGWKLAKPELMVSLESSDKSEGFRHCIFCICVFQ